MKYFGYAGYARRIVMKHAERFLRETDRTLRSAGNVEAVHRARVASRRLRNAFWVFKDVIPGKKLEKWKRELRRTADVFGSARDLDVRIMFLERMRGNNGAAGYEKEAVRLAEALKKKRAGMNGIIRAAAGGILAGDVIEDIEKTMADVSFGERSVNKKKACRLARKKIWKRVEALMGYGCYVTHPNAREELHRMRIASKKLRYTMENFEPLCGRKMRKFIDIAHRIQDLLGELHDLDVWMSSCPEERGRCFISKCGDLRKKIYRDFAAYWEQLEEKGKWDELAGFISSVGGDKDLVFYEKNVKKRVLF